MQSNLIEAEPSPEHRLTGWHNDGGNPALEVNGIRAFGSLKVGYFLRDLLSAYMGALMVVPGSHRMQGAPPFPRGARDPIGAVELMLKAGDAVIFHQGVWHASAPNSSSQSRLAVYYGYGYRMFRPVDYQRMPIAFLERCNPVQRQLFGETVTHEGFYLPADEDVPLRPWFERHFSADAGGGNLQRARDLSVGSG
jgi:ectoine hydroxylase